MEVDYPVPLTDYPDFPRDEGVDFFEDKHKSALGSNYWRYNRGTSAYWNFKWVDVSDDCAATMGMIVGSAHQLSPHVAIFWGPAIDGITTGSLLTITGSVLRGTYFCENDGWKPQEVQFGLWSFDTNFRKEA
jgi:hypothetical protein